MRNDAFTHRIARGVPSSLIIHRSSLPSPRSGISLIEVLFAMGILTIGVLAMALLIPLGVNEMSEVAKMDATATLGQAAFRNLEVQGYLRPQTWVDTQQGLLIAPDPSSGALSQNLALAQNMAHGSRLLTYPYIPNVAYVTCQSRNNVAQPAYPVPDVPNPITQVGTSVNSIGTPITTPIASSLYHYDSSTRTIDAAMPLYSANPFPSFFPCDSPTLVIDPLMIAKNIQSGTSAQVGSVPMGVQTFPYSGNNGTYCSGAPLIPRLTVLPVWPLTSFSWSTSSPVQTPTLAPFWSSSSWNWGQWNTPRIMPYAVADRLFRANDDLIFNTTIDQTHDRPTAVGGGQYQGGYSWFATVSPSTAELDAKSNGFADAATMPDPTATASVRQFNVSVVVCRNRQLDLPSQPPTAATRPGEWMVPANLTGGGLSGGEFMLMIDQTSAISKTNTGAWLAGIKPGTWMMLSGIMMGHETRYDRANGNYIDWTTFKNVTNWYRVVGIDDGAALPTPPLPPTGGIRNVTLHGPDWPPTTDASGTVQYVNLDPTGSTYIYAYATIVEGVVGVYQKTITIDGDSPWGLPQ